MKALAAALVEELNVDTAFTIPILGGIEIAESVVVTWLIMVIMVLLAIWLTHGMQVHNPGKRQVVAEYIVTALDNFTSGLLGEEGRQYGEYIATVLVFIGIANIIGVFGLKPPTKDMNVTIALSLMSIILIEAAGVRAKGPWGWVKSFTQPIAIVTPINILEIFIRPLSLCMRLFGNVLGAFVIMEILKQVAPVGLPAIFSLYFDLFDGLIQAYVFVFLTSLFVAEAVEPPAKDGASE